MSTQMREAVISMREALDPEYPMHKDINKLLKTIDDFPIPAFNANHRSIKSYDGAQAVAIIEFIAFIQYWHVAAFDNHIFWTMGQKSHCIKQLERAPLIARAILDCKQLEEKHLVDFSSAYFGKPYPIVNI